MTKQLLKKSYIELSKEEIEREILRIEKEI